MVESASGAKMASNLSCSLLVLGKSSDGVVSIRMRCGEIKQRKQVVDYTIFAESKWIPHRVAHLSERALGSAELVHHPKGDADHGGEREQPANKIAPPWVHILIVVLQGSVFDKGEGKGSLERARGVIYWRGTNNWSEEKRREGHSEHLISLLILTMHVAGVRYNQQYLM